MVKEIMMYSCENCGEMWDNEEEAENCMPLCEKPHFKLYKKYCDEGMNCQEAYDKAIEETS